MVTSFWFSMIMGRLLSACASLVRAAARMRQKDNPGWTRETAAREPSLAIVVPAKGGRAGIHDPCR